MAQDTEKQSQEHNRKLTQTALSPEQREWEQATKQTKGRLDDLMASVSETVQKLEIEKTIDTITKKSTEFFSTFGSSFLKTFAKWMRDKDGKETWFSKFLLDLANKPDARRVHLMKELVTKFKVKTVVDIPGLKELQPDVLMKTLNDVTKKLSDQVEKLQQNNPSYSYEDHVKNVLAKENATTFNPTQFSAAAETFTQDQLALQTVPPTNTATTSTQQNAAVPTAGTQSGTPEKKAS